MLRFVSTIFPSSVEQVKPPPKHPLKKLLDRIRGQRDLQAGHGVAADLPNVITDEIPEKDTSIDTGSLTSAEKSIELPVEICRTTHHGKNCPFFFTVRPCRKVHLLCYYLSIGNIRAVT